ncbi:MAG: carboxylating nicotinate-nucleotide diphosphorylase [Tepidiformaceae bacterium]
MEIEPIDATILAAIVGGALAEDHAHDDITTLATVDGALTGRARFLAKEEGVLAGLDAVRETFRQLDGAVTFQRLCVDGGRFGKGDILAQADGPVRALLQGERVALNFLQRLCGTATLTRRFADAVSGTGVAILDTRKTTPGLRALEKYAVRCGGGTNHRSDLAVMAMIKDNHREALAKRGWSLAEGVAAIRALAPGAPVEVEVDSLDDLEAALEGRPEWVLLDNMPPKEMSEAVRRTAGRAKLEASGGVTLETVRAIAETGVDAISVGALTHSARALDISLELVF